MGFEIFFSCYESGELCDLPLSEVESAFHSAIAYREGTGGRCFWRLEYPVPNSLDDQRVISSSGTEYQVQDTEFSEIYMAVRVEVDSIPVTDGFMVAGPASHTDFYAALLRLLQTNNSALFWPGGNSLVIGRSSAIEHLPIEMIESLGGPFLVTEPRQIIDRIRAS